MKKLTQLNSFSTNSLFSLNSIEPKHDFSGTEIISKFVANNCFPSLLTSGPINAIAPP